MENLRSIAIVFLLAFVVLASAAQAKTASVLLQEGLYAEEVEGDLDAAIKIYQQVIAAAKETQRAAAQATYRIGMCYLKKGEKQKAAEQFGNLISKFPEHESLIINAGKQLAKLKPIGGFGPVIERVLNDDGVGQDFLLDLDTGRLYSVSDAKKWSETSGAGQEKSLEDFIMESGVDLVGETSKKSLMGIDMIAIPTHNERWNMSPEDVIEQVSLGKPGTPVALSADGELPKIFVFKTGQGGMGILQITEMQDGKAPRHFKIRYKMLQQKLDLTAHEIFIPDADTKDVGVVLDLASGELLKAGTGQEQLTIFRKLGKGDLAYDQVLICLRGAKAKLIVSDTRGEHLTDLKIEGQMEDMTAYELELRTIPGRFVITTAEGNNYPLTILSADSKGLTLRREKVPLSTVDFDSMDFWQGQIRRYMEAVRTLEGRFITDRQSFGEGQTEPSSHERYRINFKWNRDNAWYDYSWQRLDSRFDDLPERMIKGREFSWWVHSDGRYITKAKAEAKVGLPMWRGGFSPEDEWWPGDALTINPIAELVASDFLRNVKYQLKSGLKPEKHSVDTKDNHILEIPVTGLGGEKGHLILTVDWDNGFKLLSLKVKAKEYYGEDEVLMGQWSDYIRSNDIWIAKKAIQYNYPDSGQADGSTPEVEEQYVVIAERIIANRHIPAEEFDYQPPVGKHLSDQITGSSYIIWPDFEKIKALGGKARVSIEGLAFLDGRPIENVVVSTHTYYDPDQETQKAVQCKTSQDGGFSLEGLLPGFTYRVKAATNSGMVGVETVQMPDDGRDYLNLRIDLVTGLTVTGKVSGPGNEPVANAVVLFRGHPPVTTDQSGTYTINGLTTGTGYEVQAAAKGYAPFDPGGDVIVRSYQVKLNENGEPQNLDIQLDRERFIYGRVLDKQGKGVEGVRIFIGDWPFETCSQWVNTYTDKTGQFRIGNLANQEYSVVIGSLGSRKIKPSESPVEIVYDVPEQKR